MDRRIRRTRSALLRAATDLLAEGGPSALTIEAVVARSGAARSTLYRHWKSRDDLLADVIDACAPRLPEPDPEVDVETSLRATMRFSARTLRNTEWARMLPAFIMLSRHEDEIKAINERLELQHNNVLARIIDRAAKEGLIDAGTEPERAIIHLQGPLMLAFLAATLPVDDELADDVVDRFLIAFQPQAIRSKSPGVVANAV